MNDERIEQGLRQILAPAAADGGSEVESFYRYVSGDMSPDEAAAYREDAGTFEKHRGALEAFNALEGSKPRSRGVGWWSRWWTLTPVAAAAAILLAIGYWPDSQLDGAADPSGFRTKGGGDGYYLHVGVQRGSERFSATAGSLFETGDVLGFFYTAPRSTYLVVVALDENGVMTRVYPLGAPIEVAAGARVRLPHGAVVEEGTACEWLVGFFSAEPPDLGLIEQVLHSALQEHDSSCSLPLPEIQGLASDVFTMRRTQP